MQLTDSWNSSNIRFFFSSSFKPGRRLIATMRGKGEENAGRFQDAVNKGEGKMIDQKTEEERK